MPTEIVYMGLTSRCFLWLGVWWGTSGSRATKLYPTLQSKQDVPTECGRWKIRRCISQFRPLRRYVSGVEAFVRWMWVARVTRSAWMAQIDAFLRRTLTAGFRTVPGCKGDTSIVLLEGSWFSDYWTFSRPKSCGSGWTNPFGTWRVRPSAYHNSTIRYVWCAPQLPFDVACFILLSY